MRHRTIRIACAVLLPLLLAGCFNPFRPRVLPGGGIPEPRPALFGAEGTMKGFVYAWNHRDYDFYTQLFAKDFLFVFALGDSAGQLYQGAVFDRTEELHIAKNAFIGGGPEPPATNINLQLDQSLNFHPAKPEIDPEGRFYQYVLTNVNLHITVNEPYDVYGQGRFFLVRADADSGSHVPDDLSGHDAIQRDSTRWLIYRWEDETSQSPQLALRRAPGSLAMRPYASAMARTATFVVESPSAGRPRPALPTPFSDPQTLTWGQLMAIYSGR